VYDRAEGEQITRFFLILNVAVGGGWPGDPDPSIFPQNMPVDYGESTSAARPYSVSGSASRS
jgi:hypothetical protein